MDDQSFLEAIQANPEDEVPRLVYADWLDDQGDPRGELIRVQCEIARSPDNDPNRKRLEHRESELLEDYGETWLEPLRQLGAMGVSTRCFHRGLLDHLKISAEDFLNHAETLCQIEPALTSVQFTDAVPHLKQWAEMQIPAQITSVDFSANQFTSLQCQMLAASSITGQLKALDLKFNLLEDEAVAALCSANWPKLERLDLSSNRIDPVGAATLAHQASFPQLKVLCLSMNRVLDQGAVALLQSHSLGGLEELHLVSNGITNETANLMLDSQGLRLPSLKILNLRYNRIGMVEQGRLLGSPWNRRLQLLDLTGNIRPSSY